MTRAYVDDISAERLASLQEQNLELTRLVTELRNEAALRTQFLSNISHDLRTPLTAIITHGEILRDGILGELTARQKDSVSGIIGGGRQLLDMIGEILTYARGAANQLTLTRTEFSIEQVVDQVCALNESLVARKGHTLAVTIEPGLPPLYADREKIAHVLGNLLGNAIDFTLPGGSVWIRCSRGTPTESGQSMLSSRSATRGSASRPSTMSSFSANSPRSMRPPRGNITARDSASRSRASSSSCTMGASVWRASSASGAASTSRFRCAARPE